VSLDISNNNINEVGAIFISTMLKANSTLIALNISNNNIGDVGLIFLSNNLANNKSLSYLELQNNNIGEKGIEAISDVLKVNNTLTKIVFNGNYINQQGIEYIVKAIDINSSIVTFSGFNNSTELEQIISDKVIKNIKQFEYALQLLNQKTINVSEVNCSLLLTTLKQVQVQKEQFILESDTLYKKSSIIKQLTTLTNHLQESEIYIHDDMLVPLIAQIERDQ
jgi:Ran GTPase-activating protein (RanGAP) involved in mRNA processing and transport